MWTNQFKKIVLNKNYQAGGYNLEPLSGMVSMTAAGTVYTGHIDNVTLAMSNPMYNANIYVTPVRTSSTYSSFIALGAGNTTPSADDTNLANLLDASVLGVVSASTSEPVKNTDGTYTCTFTKTLINNSANAITIKEWGIVIWISDNASKSYHIPILAYRDVLSTAATIPAGQLFTFSVTITMPDVGV